MVDSHKLASETVDGRNGRQLNECRDAPVGEPGKPVDEFLVLVDCIVARRLNLIDASQREWGREFHGRVRRAGVHLRILGKSRSLRSQATQPFKIDDLGSWRVESL